MTKILTTAWKPIVAMFMLASSLGVANTAHAGHQRCNPAAEAHMNTAIRLMNIACDKPIHASKALARAAVVHISLAQRFVRTPGANAELCGAKATLERFIYSHCSPPFHGAIGRTRLALELERSVCVCGRPACRGGCQAPLPVLPRHGVEPHLPTRLDHTGGFRNSVRPVNPDSFDPRNGYQEPILPRRDYQDPVDPRQDYQEPGNRGRGYQQPGDQGRGYSVRANHGRDYGRAANNQSRWLASLVDLLR